MLRYSKCGQTYPGYQAMQASYKIHKRRLLPTLRQAEILYSLITFFYSYNKITFLSRLSSELLYQKPALRVLSVWSHYNSQLHRFNFSL